jgi:hypothetical protein
MNAAAGGQSAATPEPAWAVTVQDRTSDRPARHYTSPAHTLHGALTLVELLLGAAPGRGSGAGSWTRAIPGGRREIALAPSTPPPPTHAPSRHEAPPQRLVAPHRPED